MTKIEVAKNIFIDTNVLIGAFSERLQKKNDLDCLKYLYSLRGKNLFISSLSIAQLVSVFQKSKDNEEIKSIVNRILSKFTVLSFNKTDIEVSMKFDFQDMEDNIQYVISQKRQCFYFITNNVSDYTGYINLKVIKPTAIRLIKK